MNACTDALFTVLKGYFLAFACKELGIENLDSDLNHSMFTSKSSDLEKQKFIVCLSMKVVENCTLVGNALVGKEVKECGDHKYNYTRSLCHYASLALEFHDAWHEGDGNRIIRCWRVFLLQIWTDKILTRGNAVTDPAFVFAITTGPPDYMGPLCQHPWRHGAKLTL